VKLDLSAKTIDCLAIAARYRLERANAEIQGPVDPSKRTYLERVVRDCQAAVAELESQEARAFMTEWQVEVGPLGESGPLTMRVTLPHCADTLQLNDKRH
jgi:hypothetical protein